MAEQNTFIPMSSNLHGRVKNTALQVSHGLMPLFEAVVNSIHSLEDANKMMNGSITVEIVRNSHPPLTLADTKKKPGPEALAEITSFRITDNGIGFTDIHWESFQILDSPLKADRGCRGIGRILWLKAFSSAKISSVFSDNHWE